MFVAFRFRYVNQLNTDSNIYATTVQSTENFLTYTSKWRKFLCFATASQTWASLSLRRLLVYKTTRLQVADASLVVSLTSCLVVWRSNAKLNFRSSVVPTIALRQQCSKIKSISYSSNGLLSC